MDRQQAKQRFRDSKQGIFGTAALAVMLMSASSGLAQTSSYQPATDNVYINWGALNGGGTQMPAPAQPSYGYPAASAATGGLLMPGASMPQSTLHVPPPSGSAGIALRTPGTAPRTAPKPAAPQVASPAPAPEPAPAPAPAEAAPKKLAEKKAPPAPPAPAPAKTVTASAPPPPPAPDTASAPPPPPPMPSSGTPEAPQVAAKPAEAPAAPAVTEQAKTSTETPADGPVKVIFNGDDTKLSADGQSALESVLGELSANENNRVQLMAYAAGDDLTSSKARRISLSRALSVRSYLIEKGVRSTRIDVRALGDKSDGDPKNRVDVNVIER
ncbi:MAG: OmpA family protein [Rhodospirillales bacterium]